MLWVGEASGGAEGLEKKGEAKEEGGGWKEEEQIGENGKQLRHKDASPTPLCWPLQVGPQKC